jgi:hypothetical protein
MANMKTRSFGKYFFSFLIELIEKGAHLQFSNVENTWDTFRSSLLEATSKFKCPQSLYPGPELLRVLFLLASYQLK